MSKQYHFYGWEYATVPAVSDQYAGIRTPQNLYDALAEIWCADTCAPRLRSDWTPENRTLGQCSITAFLAQDIFGGEVYGILRPGGNYHCYNVVGDCVFDLTSEQFGGEVLDYSDNPLQSGDVHFAKEEKRARYEKLKEDLQAFCGRHMPEKVIFMNMCMLCEGKRVLALDKTGSNYSGTTFPGGHVEAGETFSEAVIREMKEETGLTIHHPILKGIYHWYRDGLHNVGLLYRAESFEGELQSSEEGRVYWIPREEYEKKELAAGMRQVLQIMDDENLTECFEELQPDGSFLEHLF